jgi:hypothetical protein
VVVAAVDHPGLDEVVAAERFVLQDDPGLRERLRNPDSLPDLAVERLAHDVLDLGIAGRADEQRQLGRKVVPPIDQAKHGIGQVVAVRRCRTQHPVIKVRDHAMLVDLGYLLRE